MIQHGYTFFNQRKFTCSLIREKVIYNLSKPKRLKLWRSEIKLNYLAELVAPHVDDNAFALTKLQTLLRAKPK
ncbi:hypothetical protein BJD20_11675 [Acinetobacter proteolyticus]|nr:hypothetical protein BJD20_11675 [Acinetobacter proteolyticus]